MSYQGLAQPAPTVDEAKALAPRESKAVIVEAAKDEVEETHTVEAAPVVSEAVVGDYQKFAPGIAPPQASALSVEELRKKGADFESEAGVIKGGVKKDILKRLLPFFFDERDFLSYGEIRRYVFVRGNFIFVYGGKSDPRPLYAIELPNYRAVIEDPAKPDKYSYTVSPQAGTNLPPSYLTTVLLKDKHTGKQSYQITFDTQNDKSVMKRFMDVFRVNAKHYAGEIVTASVIHKKVEKK
mmetsp:Transcript_25099/g.58821  ORF Transcript_25099/g.58821 Transcript_25099/m.58821 type:complete len:239 (+) Transcript_25099:90-806(+)|eukprot:CAMPEP_0197183746 /NCGR_PEP_ID=MMETSP1423-20130617/8197_1 /TAXON_ID=476441 /ORGANISM="Pseudo-nitzschia heimii, Strain UNC1101" /LENGTH=238 /DNA_ID=CAMNT_0042634363 /DNA_START=90 /DNA_END=806 /DNA_ORIENTATION=-